MSVWSVFHHAKTTELVKLKVCTMIIYILGSNVSISSTALSVEMLLISLFYVFVLRQKHRKIAKTQLVR